MWARKQLDIGWFDLAFGIGACFRSDPSREDASPLPSGSDDRASIVCQSVRSGFDLLLGALDWPVGSEIVVSAVTIGDMVRIINDHGFIAVPADLDPRTAAPTIEQVERAVTERTRAILIAHLFGGWIPLEPFVELARKYNLILIEDCAQAWDGESGWGDGRADVSLFSFGTIKTATALGGAVLKLRDNQLTLKMRAAHESWPVQPRWEFCRKLFKAANLKWLSLPLPFGLLIGLLKLARISTDRWLNRTVRGFPGPEFWFRLRRRPAAPLHRLLQRRVSQPQSERISQRRARGERLKALLGPSGICPGRANARHSHWVFPVFVEKPSRLLDALQREGFDGTQGESLVAVPAPADRPDLIPQAALRLLAHIVYVPCYEALPWDEVDRLGAAILRSLAESVQEEEPPGSDSPTSHGTVPSADRRQRHGL